METPEVLAARRLTAQAAQLLQRNPDRLEPGARDALAGDLERISAALGASAPARDPYALALETPADLLRRRQAATSAPEDPAATDDEAPAAPKKQAATQAIAARTGALIDEIDFPTFVASLVHGTFDAMVDASIRQMEAFAELVGAVAKDIDRFTSENVTPNQARDDLAAAHPAELVLDFPGGQPALTVREEHEGETPSWLADYGLEGEALSDAFVEDVLVPAARRRRGESRVQMLATMVLMGMNRINVRDGSISAKVRFRAAARDKAAVAYASAQDAGSGATWGARGGPQNAAQMMISTVGANVQADADLRAELFGEVKINFVSETLPLERFVDAAQLALLQRNANTIANAPSTGPTPAASAAPTSEAPATLPPAP